MDVATSPTGRPKEKIKIDIPLIRLVSVDTCKINQLVLVVWNPQYECYTIFQHSNSIYFLHAECVEPLGLKASSNETRKLCCVGVVVHKEYCHAKKVRNSVSY